jgi:hypothetical protein
MKTTTTENRTNLIPQPASTRGGRLRRSGALLGVAAAALLAARTAPAQFDPSFRFFPEQRVGDVFVIALENHNLTQPVPTNSPQQILGNPAAPYLNSLITPGSSNSAQVSYATAYYNAGAGVHPSEPNYVWAEAGSDFGFHSDSDPSPANGNTFYDLSNHLVGQLTAAGIPWKDYQEDVQLSASPTNSASGTNGPVNAYNGTTEYNYAVKHNPMAFFADSAVKNVYPLSQLFPDLSNNTVGRYNWITPDQYNEAHSSLNGGFTYQGTHYNNDQAAVAEADNFLSIVVPQIMASKAYQDNGVIILWWDETENGDDTNHTLGEIIISRLAKGNAYASFDPMSHSSDIKTMEEIFGLPLVNNPIPSSETAIVNTPTGFNNVAVVNDLSDLFRPGVIPPPADIAVFRSPFVEDPRTHHFFQLVSLHNEGPSPEPAPVYLVLDNLGTNATLANADGTTSILTPLDSPYVRVPLDRDDFFGTDSDEDYLRPGQTAAALLEFLDPSRADITYDTRVLSVIPTP